MSRTRKLTPKPFGADYYLATRKHNQVRRFGKKKKKERDIHLAAPVASSAKGKRFFTSSEYRGRKFPNEKKSP
jgi:hypothetical protein